MATQFKFTKADGLTRRMTFSELPSWTALAMKIESLYSIPIEKVAVSYVDADGDEVTLSSQEELLDFYANCHKRGEAVRFNVMDLSSVRSRGVTTSPNTDDAKMTTGLGHMGPTMLFEVDDSDWQPLSSFPGIFTLPRAASPSVPDHAYVEVVESDVQSEGKNDLDRQSSIFNAAEVPIVTVDDVSLEAFGDKGKQREMDTDSVTSFKKPLSPTVEELDERDEDPLDILQTPTAPKSRLFSPEMPAIDSFGKPLPKTPSTRPVSFDHFAPPYSPRSAGFSNLENMVKPMSDKQETVRGDNAGDPPLESTGAQQSSAAPSLSSDVANFLDALASAFNTHPELSEGFRNIVRNATNGLYWNKEGLSDAAEHISRNWLHGDEDAGSRVAQSLASVFKVIGDATAVGSNAAPAGGPGSDYRPFVPVPPGGDRHFWNSPPPPPPGFGVPAPPPGFPGSPFPPFHPGHPGAPPPHPPHHPFGSPMHPPPMHPPPPPPPGPPRHGPFSPPPGPPGHSGMPPPLPPPPGHNGPAPGIPPHQRTHPGWIEQIMGDVGVPRRSNTWSGTYRGPANPPPPRRIPDDYMSPHDRKAMLETAKAHYKAEKERFRLEKEERKRSRREVEERREREANGPVVFDNGETVITRIPLKVFEASPNTWNRSGGPSADSSTRRRPYAEVYSVPSPPRAQPQPHAAISSRTTSIHEPEVEKSESNIRILSRLADMGFTPSSHPTLPALLEKEVRADEILSTHEEDDAVMHVLETLISNTSVSPRPSGSNLA